MFHLEDMDFGRRLAVEKELDSGMVSLTASSPFPSPPPLIPPHPFWLQDEPGATQPNAVFDESGNFLLYSSLVGVKVVNLVSNTVCRVLGERRVV